MKRAANDDGDKNGTFDHYNKRQNTSSKKRQDSPSISLKRFNNWLKAVMIQTWCKVKGMQALDLCGGKGGDLLKWYKAGISHLTLVDGASVSVEHALNRYNTHNGGVLLDAFPALFACADCNVVDLNSKFHPDLRFDIVSCQFAFHYSFASEKTAHKFMKNVAQRLKPGGYFIGTIPNAGRVVKRLIAAKNHKYGNSLYSVDFPQDVDTDHIPAFGARYNFSLIDAVENVPEFLVHPSILETVAKHHGLKVVQPCLAFDHFYTQHKESHAKLLKDMNVGSLSEEEWQCITLYSCFVFQKEGKLQLTPPPDLEEQDKVLDFNN